MLNQRNKFQSIQTFIKTKSNIVFITHNDKIHYFDIE